MRPRIITKFGGTSLADKRAWLAVLDILESCKEQQPLVVVSAVGKVPDRPKVTDLLQALADEEEGMDELRSIHVGLLRDLELPAQLLEPLFDKLAQAVADKEVPELVRLDRIMGFGERLSSTMMAAALSARGWESKAADPEEIGLVTDDQHQDASILDSSLEELAKQVIASREHLVVPGYIGVNHAGEATTLGRGGSDYTAAALGAALKRDVEIWTDVNGVAAANPLLFSEELRDAGHPRTIPRLSHEEAYQMAAFGSRVLYQKCLNAARLAARKGRHLRMIVKNTFEPEHPGTIIESHASPDGRPRGITALEGVQLLTVYLDKEEHYHGLFRQVADLPGAHLLMASYSTGRASFVFDRLTDELEELERQFRDAHLSRDQVLIKVVGDGLGHNHSVLGAIHQVVDQLNDPERFGAPLLHKSPQLLTDSTFEAIALKRGAEHVIRTLYKELFCQGELSVGLLGMGTVAGGVLSYSKELFSREKTGLELLFPKALVRDLNKVRPGFEGELTTSADDILEDPRIDLVVELMGGVEPAREYILKAFQNGKHVITANKAVLAEHGPEIFAAARRYKRNLGFEASVCGEIPVLEVVQDMPSSEDVDALTGIFNGTSNYILTRMASGESYGQALVAAQEAGFAEADPTLDVGGADATQKLAILSSLVFHTPLDWRKIHCLGIQEVQQNDVAEAHRLGYAIRPLAHARRHPEGLELWVSPAWVSHHHSLAMVEGENAGVALQLRGRTEPFSMVGKGAGALPTARSVVRDIFEVARESRHRMLDLPNFFESPEIPVLGGEAHRNRWWVRFTVEDAPGVFGELTTLLGEAGLSIDQASQQQTGTEEAAVMLMLKAAPRTAVETAMTQISKRPHVKNTLALVVLD